MLGLSEELLDYAVELTSNGKHEEAIELYRLGLLKMLVLTGFEECEYSHHACRLAKCYYLDRQFDKVLSCYNSILFLTVWKHNAEIITDFLYGNTKFYDFAKYLAEDIGYTLDIINKKHIQSSEEEDYYDYDEEKEEERYIAEGLDYISSVMQSIVEELKKDDCFYSESLLRKKSRELGKNLFYHTIIEKLNFKINIIQTNSID